MLLGLCLIAVQETSPSNTFGTDPTETLTRIEVMLDYSNLRLDAVRSALRTRVDYGFLERFALRADVPFAQVDPDGGSTESGLGDVRAQFGWRAFDDRSFAMFFAGGVVLDTAEEDALGTGSDQIVLMAAGAGALPEIRSRLTETLEHFVSFDTSEGGEGVALTKFDIQLMTEWSPSSWTRAGTELFLDWKHGDQIGMNLDLEVGRANASGFAVWFGPAVGLFGQDIDGVVDWRLSVGARWLF